MSAVRALEVIAASCEAFLPSLCPHCGRALAGGNVALCGDCWSAMVPLSGRCCPRCGGPSEDLGPTCLNCHRQPPPQLETVTWGEYDGVLRTAVLALKHRQRDELADPLAGLLAARLSITPWAATLGAVTPVPSHWARRLRRGWPAAVSLARAVSRRLKRPYLPALRRHGLHRQSLRTRAQRLDLEPSSFSASADVTGLRILLIDDVTTTGATLRRAAEALLGAGARIVYCAAVARTPDPRRAA